MIDKKNWTIVFVLIYYYIYLYIYVYYYIIYYYIFIFIFIYYYIYIYIIIIYIVMCPKNGTIFMLRVPRMGLFIFGFCFLYLVYVYMGNIESTPGVVFGWDFAASCFYILKSMDFIWVLVWYFGIGDFSVMKSVSGLFVAFGLGWEDSTI